MMQQAVSGITGALGGAVGGVMGPLTQLPQQAMQAGQGAMQPLMSALQQTYGAEGLDVADGARLVDSIEGEPGLGGEPGAGDVGAGGGGGGTTPTGYLGPPPVPTSSPPTTPAGAPAKSVTPDPVSGTPRASGPAGMTGMPMVPPGALGAGAEGANKDKPVEKRVTAPAVPNGQPVKGRLTVPPSVPVKSADDKPVVTKSTRRILVVPNDDKVKERNSRPGARSAFAPRLSSRVASTAVWSWRRGTGRNRQGRGLVGTAEVMAPGNGCEHMAQDWHRRRTLD